MAFFDGQTFLRPVDRLDTILYPCPLRAALQSGSFANPLRQQPITLALRCAAYAAWPSGQPSASLRVRKAKAR